MRERKRSRLLLATFFENCEEGAEKGNKKPGQEGTRPGRVAGLNSPSRNHILTD